MSAFCEPACKRGLILLSIGALGVSAVMTQLALMREMLSAFAGNELSLGVILGNWLLLTGAGAWLGRKADRLRHPIRALVWSQIMVALLPPAQVFLLRTLRNQIFVRGSAVGVTETVLSSFLLLLPYCVVSGFMLTLACALLNPIGQDRVVTPPRLASRGTAGDSAAGRTRWRVWQRLVRAILGRAERTEASLDLRGTDPALFERAATGVADVYVADSLGSVIGGVLFTFVLLSWFDHSRLLCLPALVNLGLGALVAWNSGLRALSGASVGLGLGLVLLMMLADVDALSTALQFSQQRIIFRGNSPYGRLIVTESGGQVNFIENGVPVISSHNIEQVEETVHYPMAQRPSAGKVLLVAGGVSGTAKEILKYGVAQVTYVELDPLIIAVGREYLAERLADARIQVINTDGRRFIRQTDERYDVVIVDVPDPSTSQLNRFYTAEFVAEAKRALVGEGVFSFALGRYENYVSPELARLLSSAYKTLCGAFKHVLVLPGGRVFFLGSDGPLYPDVGARIEQQGVLARLVTRHYLDAMFSPDRMGDIRRATLLPAVVNTDLSPVLYYYHLRHWMSQFRAHFGVLGGLLLAVLGVYLAKLRAVPLAVFASGFAASSLEIILLLGFQILYGSLYQQMGFIVTMFMVGLALGAFLAGRVPSLSSLASSTDCPVSQGTRGRRSVQVLVFFSLAIGAFALLLPAFLSQLQRLDTRWASSIPVWVVIPCLTLILAGLVGAEFAWANRVAHGQLRWAASRLYTADFMGACLGALLTSTLLIPLIGVTATCLVTAGLNVIGGAVVLWRQAPGWSRDSRPARVSSNR
jgi:spermidine synthase